MIKFRRKQAKESTAGRDIIAQSIATRLLRVQQVWAAWMNKHSDRCNPKLRGALLIIFLVSMAAISMTMLLGGFKSRNKLFAQTNFITVPHVISTEEGLSVNTPTDVVLQRIKKIRLYLDSLSETSEGKIKLDSINRLHPGLQDSIKMIEIIYQQ